MHSNGQRWPLGEKFGEPLQPSNAKVENSCLITNILRVMQGGPAFGPPQFRHWGVKSALQMLKIVTEEPTVSAKFVFFCVK